MDERCEVSTSTEETSTVAADTKSTASTQISSSTSPNPHAKIKALQQQQQQQLHQFRTPQQFVKHRKPSNSSLNKKNKTWNKRQNKIVKQQQLQTHAATAFSGSSSSIVTGALSSSTICGTIGIAKADLENIQNVKAQIGSGGVTVSYHQAHHSQHHQHSHHPHNSHSHYIGAGHRCTSTASVTTTCGPDCRSATSLSATTGSSSVALHPSTPIEKICYSHGHHHLNKQMYKKVVAHRGHYHNHVLCAGAAHNSHCSGSVSSGSCCLLHNCTTQNGVKDKDSTCSHMSASSSIAGGNSCSSLHYCCGRAKFFLPDKRLRKEIIVPPTKFLLGGNISDPLNLNSLQNDSTSSNNTPATTPRRSPITTPPKVEVIIPPNIHDPLHLLDPVDSMEYEKQLTSPLKRHLRGPALLNKPFKPGRNRKNRKRRRHDSYGSTVSSVDGSIVPDASGTQKPAEGFPTSAETISNTYTGAMASPDVGERIAEKEDGEWCTAVPSFELEFEKEPSNQLQKSQAVETETDAQILSINSSTSEYIGPVTRERSNRDLRLDLNSTSTTNSTCSSVTGISTLSSMSGHKGSFGRGRKRKISETNNSIKNKKLRDSLDKIVSPVVPQPGAWKRPPRQAASGARKTTRRSTSVSESELLSPAEESARPWPVDTNCRNVDLTEINKCDTASEVGPASPQSTISGCTSIATAEQDLSRDTTAFVYGTAEAPNKSDNLIENADLSNSNSKPITTKIEHRDASSTTQEEMQENLPKLRIDGQKYRYGNYDRYKGVRQLNEFIDVRLHIFSRNAELFENKDVLDIGCNTGQMTISVARDLAPKSILGIDIDKEMIKRARRNLSMFVRIPSQIGFCKTHHEFDPITKEKHVETDSAKRTASVNDSLPSQALIKNTHKNRKSKKQRLAAAARAAARQPATAAHLVHHHHLLHHHHHHDFHHLNNNWHPGHPNNRRSHVYANELFPISFPLNFGSLDKFGLHNPPVTSSLSDSKSPASRTTPAHPSLAAGYPSNEFPKNVFFKQMNYVLKDEAQLSVDTQQYDLILCLSVTKWIHLNFGDAGLKMAFKRIFNQLRPGGKLILEAQNWASYKKKSNLTAEIHKNYQTIEFFPNKFHEYLLSSDVGFSHSYTLGVPRHLNKGFGRPIQLYAKGDYTPNHVRWSDAYYPNTPFEEYRGIYAFMPPRSSAYAWSYAKSSTRSQPYETPHHVSGGASGPYSCRQTPVYHPTYNPLETDSYQPSYDMEYMNHMDVLGSPGSPLYQTVWSPPASLRNSSSHTPVYGSVREVELDGDVCGQYRRHVYPPNDDTFSPNANAGGAFNSIRDPDTDDSAGNTAVQHVYATHCGESSSSPQVLRPESEITDETVISDEDVCNAIVTSTNFTCEQ